MKHPPTRKALEEYLRAEFGLPGEWSVNAVAPMPIRRKPGVPPDEYIVRGGIYPVHKSGKKKGKPNPKKPAIEERFIPLTPEEYWSVMEKA